MTMAALCRECHNAIDRGLNDRLLADLRWKAYVRLARLLNLTLRTTHFETGENGLFEVRAYVRWADEHGITHPDYVPPSLSGHTTGEPA